MVDFTKDEWARVCRRNAAGYEAAEMRAQASGQYELAVDYRHRAEENRRAAERFERGA